MADIRDEVAPDMLDALLLRLVLDEHHDVPRSERRDAHTQHELVGNRSVRSTPAKTEDVLADRPVITHLPDERLDGVVDKPVAPHQRLAWGKTVGLGAQHVVAMFGATFVFPLLMGLNPQLAVMMSGIATLIFLLVVRGRVPRASSKR